MKMLVHISRGIRLDGEEKNLLSASVVFVMGWS